MSQSNECQSENCCNESRTNVCDDQACLEEVLSMTCPVEKSAQKWTGAFFQAMKETQVDLLKEKIKKAWGSDLDKQADAVIKAMGNFWCATLARAKSQVDLREDIKKIYCDSVKK